MRTLLDPEHSTDDRPTEAGDHETRFVLRHQLGLCRFLRLMGCGAHAEEIAQQALLIALEHDLHLGDGDRTAAQFLRRAAKNVWLRQRRDEQLRRRRQAEAAEMLWQRELARDDGDGYLDALDHCLEQLPARSRRALDATYMHGLSRRELAAELDLTEHGARTLLQRLRAGLRECIERRRRP